MIVSRRFPNTDAKNPTLRSSLHRLFRRRRPARPAPPALPAATAASPAATVFPAALTERLAAIERQQETVRQQVEALAASDAAWQQALANLGTQISRAGREQFKVNTLAEAQRDQMAAALEQLRTAAGRQDAELIRSAEERRTGEAAARLAVIETLFPVLDGLDEALRVGGDLLAAQPSGPSGVAGFRARLLPNAAIAIRVAGDLRGAMESWLAGLTLIRQRLLDVLAAEGVRPMVAAGQPFDPHYHVAMEAVSASASFPAGTVVAVLRRGYLSGERVLRFAEVTVAQTGASGPDHAHGNR